MSPVFSFAPPDLANTGPLLHLSVSSLEGDTDPSTRLNLVAMVDTGSSHSVIKAGLVSRVGVAPTDRVSVRTVNETVECFLYTLRIEFPEHIPLECDVIESEMRDQAIEFLIGRDLLSHSVFLYSGLTNSFSLSF